MRGLACVRGPGFPLHNSGKSLDFTGTVSGEMLICDRTQRTAW